MTEIAAATARPDAPPASALGEAFDAFAHESMHALYARARGEEPIFHAPDIGYWVVTRHADLVTVFRDPARFSAANTLTPVTALPPEVSARLRDGGFTVTPVQSNADAPVHGRVRSVAGQFLNAKRFLAYEAPIRQLVASYVDDFDGEDEIDIVARLTYELPARVIFLLMGIDDIDTLRIKRWADDRLMLTWGRLGPDAQVEAADRMLEYWNYCRELVEDRRATPGEDYPSALLRIRDGDDAVLGLNEVCCLVFGILLAGHETTTNASSNLIATLLRHPDQWARLVDDPALIPRAVEEGLRFATSVVNWRRVVTRDTTLGGVSLPAGSNLLLALASANRDEAVFEDAERFDIERAGARRHLSFGHGVHACIGAPLARMQLRIVLEELTGRFPHMSLVPDQPLDWIRTISFRGPTALRVRLGDGGRR